MGYRVIVDLRDNPGGDDEPFQSLINGIKADPKINRHGRIFGLVNQFTDSSATLDAQDLSQKTNGLLVGQPPEDPVDEYGNEHDFELPASGIVVQYTTRVVNPNNSKTGVPSILVAATLRQVLAGDDPVLAKALSYGRTT